MNNLIDQLAGPLLFLVIIIIGFLLLLGKSKIAGGVLKGATKLVIVGFLVVAVALPVMQEQLKNANSPKDVAILIIGGLFALIFMLTVVFGFGFVTRLAERIFSAFVYDVLKGTFKFLFKGFSRFFELFR